MTEGLKFAELPSTPSEELEILSDSEKFGNCQAIERILGNGEIANLVDIDTLRPELADSHVNAITVGDVSVDPIDVKHINRLMFLEIHQNGAVIQGLFKPLSGESQEVKQESKDRTNVEIDNFYQKERAAYVMDRLLGFGLTPPTAIRKINGEIGALQLYIPPNIADNEELLTNEIDTEKRASGVDWQLMAVFDYLIGNGERKPSNWLVNIADNSKLYAIDHGMAFYHPGIEKFERRGPRQQISWNEAKRRYENVPLPNIILNRLKYIQENKKPEIRDQLSGLMPDREIELVLRRLDELIEKKIFL